MGKPDNELMVEYQEGSERAFNELYTRHKGKVYGFIFKKTGNKEMTADIYQEVFHKLHTNKMKFDGKREFLPWFFVLCHNVIIDHIRKIRTDIDTYVDDQPSKYKSYDLVDKVEAMALLSPKEKSIIRLKFDQGFDYHEISRELGISNSNARKMFSRTIQKLKKIMGPDNE